MSQVSSFTQANGSGNVVRSGFNAINDAQVTKNSGSVTPTDLKRYMDFVDDAPADSEWNVRNGANSAFIKFAEFVGGNIRLFSDGAAIPSVGAANVFTADQTIRLAAAVGQLLLGSQLSSGIAARLAMRGHSSTAAERIYAQIEADIESNTNGSEDGRLLLSLIRGGIPTEIMRLGAGVQVGSPTGGLPGAGLVNAEGFEIEGVDILTTIAAASSATWSTATFSSGANNLDLSSFRNFDLTLDSADVTLNFLTPTNQIGRMGLIRLNNTSGGDRTVTLSNANSVEIGGGFTTDGTTVVSSGTERYLLFVVKSTVLAYVFEFVGESGAAAGVGHSSIEQFDLTSAQSADPLLRLQPIADGETQRVVLHDVGKVDNNDHRLLVRAATASAVLAPGTGAYKTQGSFGNSGPADDGIAVGRLLENLDRTFGELLIRRTNSTLWVHANSAGLEFQSAGADPTDVYHTTGTFGGDTFDRWVLDFISSDNPSSGSTFTVYRDIA